MRALQRVREIHPRVGGSFQNLLAQFCTATLDLKPSLGISEFAKRLTGHVVEMFHARAAVFAVSGGAEWQIAAISGPAYRWDGSVQRQLAQALFSQANVPSFTASFTDSTENLLGTELAAWLGWNYATMVRLRSNENALLGVLCVADINHDLSKTERQLLEALCGHAAVALENAELFSRIEQSRKQWVEDVDAISDLILIHDAHERVLRLNKALAAHLNLPLTDVIGRDVANFPIFSSGESPSCRFCGEDSSHNEFTDELSGRTYIVSTSRAYSSGDNESRTIHVLKDITSRREMERLYRRERDLNTRILDNTQSMILVMDADGRVTYANRRCADSSYQESCAVGDVFQHRVPVSCQPQFAEAFRNALMNDAVERLDLTLSRGNGESGKFIASLSPMRDQQENSSSVVMVMTDVTEATELQAKLIHTDKMAALGQLVSGVAHEVNNPLAAIVGFTDLLLENPEIPAEAKEDLNIILQESHRTRNIVQNLLRFARQVPAKQELVQANSVLRQTVKLRSYNLANHGVEVFENLDDSLPLILGDTQQLQQVFLNILNNAFDAMQSAKRPGRLEVATALSGNFIEIAFRDNGTGIANPEKIFDPFFTTKEVGKGTGLGLSICYGIIQSHQGEIFAENNADGDGCTFLIRLPVATCVDVTKDERAHA